MKKKLEKPPQQVSPSIARRRFAETLLNSLPGMAYRCTNDRSWTMTYVSGGCEALTGYKQDAFVDAAKGWADLVHAEDRDEARRAVDAAVLAGQEFDIQYRIIDGAGRQKWVREQGRGVGQGDGNGVAQSIEGYIADITPLVSASVARINEELRQKHEQLAHADRLNTLGEMASGIAHEINQPLTAISLFAQAGRRLVDTGDYGRLHEIFDKLSLHSRRAGSIIERVQDLARHKQSIRQTINLNRLIDDVVELAEVDARNSGIDIEVCSESDFPEVNADVVQIQQVILNLLRNGMDAMRSLGCRNGKAIRITTRDCEDGTLEVAVSDSGCGVSDDAAESLFEPFSTSKKSGLGMGLPISKAIIIEHGGQLSFSNNDTVGATFRFTLPAAVRGNDRG